MEWESKGVTVTEGEREGLKTRPLKRCMSDLFGGKQNLSVFVKASGLTLMCKYCTCVHHFQSIRRQKLSHGVKRKKLF